MHGACFEYPLQKWFDVKVPRTTVAPDHISAILEKEEYAAVNPREGGMAGPCAGAGDYDKIKKKGNSGR